jgi:hypothetical protein
MGGKLCVVAEKGSSALKITLFRIRTVIALALMIGAFASCTSIKLTSFDDALKGYDLQNTPRQTEYPDFPAIVLVDEQEIGMDRTWSGGLFFWKNCTRIMKVFKSSDHFGVFEIILNNGEVLTSLAAYTITPDGTRLTVQPSDITWMDNRVHNDFRENATRTAYVSFPVADSGSVLCCQWSITSKSSFYTIEWRYQKQLPVVNAVCKINVPAALCAPEADGGAGFSVDSRFYNTPRFSPWISRMNPNMKQFVFSLKNINPFYPEVSSPPFTDLAQSAFFQLSKDATWNQLGSAYYRETIQPLFERNIVVETATDSVIAHCSTDVEKVSRLFRFVAKMRYEPVRAILGGVEPQCPDKVLRHRAGDCKDKAVLLCAMLHRARINAYPALILTKDKGSVDSTFPWFNFNHMITVVEHESGRIWLDATEPLIPAGTLPWHCRNNHALVLKDEREAGLWTTPAFDSLENAVVENTVVSVDSLSGVRAYRAMYTFTGEFARQVSELFLLLTHTNKNDALRALFPLLPASGDLRLIEYADSLPHALFARLTLAYVDSMQKNKLAEVEPLCFSIGKVDKNALLETRCHPLWLQYPWTVESRFTVKFNKRFYRMRQLPLCAAGTCRDASFDGGVKDMKDSIVLTYRLAIKTDMVAPKGYKEFKSVMTCADRFYGKPVLFEKANSRIQ